MHLKGCWCKNEREYIFIYSAADASSDLLLLLRTADDVLVLDSATGSSAVRREARLDDSGKSRYLLTNRLDETVERIGARVEVVRVDLVGIFSSSESESSLRPDFAQDFASLSFALRSRSILLIRKLVNNKKLDNTVTRLVVVIGERHAAD